MSVKRNAEILKFLASCSKPSSDLVNITPDLLKAFAEIAYNFLYIDLPLTVGEKRLLKRYKEQIRQLVSKKTSLQKAKKKILSTPGLIKALVKPTVRLLYGAKVRAGAHAGSRARKAISKPNRNQ